MKDMVTVGGLIVGFALLATVHVALVWGLVFRKPRWRALVAFVLPPAAPFFGFKEKMRVRSTIWIVAAVVYGFAFWFAR